MPPQNVGAARGAVIILMGEIGAGKSTFICVAGGDKLSIKPMVGHSLTSCTQSVQEYRIPSPRDANQYVRLIDTPGFNDLEVGDDDQVCKIIEWLKLEPETKIAGILFLHGIDQERITQTGFGPRDIPTPPEVSIITTKWDARIAEDKKTRHENELREHFSRAEVLRFHNTQASAWELIDKVQATSTSLTQKRFQKDLQKVYSKFKQRTSFIEKMKGLFRSMFA